MTELINSVSSLGLGAVIAVIVLYWKRQDDEKHALQLANLVESYEKRGEKVLDIIKEQTLTIFQLEKTVQNILTLDKIQDKIEKMSV
jgi:hypothetical protein